MAIMKDFYLPVGTNLSDFFEDSGFEVVTKKEPYFANNVYIKIETINTNVTEAVMTVSFRKEKDSSVLMTKQYQFDINLENESPNIFDQGYTHLKTLEEFKGALSA